jgi:hypothetical protein
MLLAMRRLIPVLLALGALSSARCTPSEAYASAPNTMSDPMQYIRVGGTHWDRQWTLPTSAGTAGLVLNTPGDNSYAAGDPHLFEWGTSVRIGCQAAAIFHWVMDTSVLIATSGLVTDSAPMTGEPTTGGNASFRVEAGTFVEETIMRSMFAHGRVGRRTGFCTGTTSGAQERWPCDADADCPGGACRGESNGSCVESGTNYCSAGRLPFDMIAGGFLQSLGATAADCWVSEVR